MGFIVLLVLSLSLCAVHCHEKADIKYKFQVEAPEQLVRHALTRSPDIDVWRLKRVPSKAGHPLTLAADLYATNDEFHAFHEALTAGSARGQHLRHSRQYTPRYPVKRVDEQALIRKDREEVAACRQHTAHFMDSMNELEHVTDSAFFDCFRPQEEMLAFLDALVEAFPQHIERIDNVSYTYEGRAIPVYKIGRNVSDISRTKDALYTQSLIHAREWIAGSSTVYVMARLVDGLRAQTERVKFLFSKFDWYFTPIVNMDGYEYTWKHDRLWRKNRHQYINEDGEEVDGVDLNRNFPPEEYFNADPTSVDDETTPGEYPLSEPSSSGIFKFLKSLKQLRGIVDMHSFGGEVLRPYSNHHGEPDEPFGSYMKDLGNSVAKAMSHYGAKYRSGTGEDLYPAYGCFDDGMFMEFNSTVPAITIEVEGSDFIAPQSSIRSIGENIYRGLNMFALECMEYGKMVDKLKTRKH